MKIDFIIKNKIELLNPLIIIIIKASKIMFKINKNLIIFDKLY